MNRMLAISRNSIPYLPEMRSLPLIKNTSAVVLMQQLDYWFDKYPEGFYKFTAPCASESYKPGDSWCEELHFSKDEFRSAFDQIGIRYNSKTAYCKSANPFLITALDGQTVEKYYCSYTDKIKGLTFYFRNNKRVDKDIDALLNGSFTTNRETQPSKTEVPDLRKSGNPISVNRECQSTEVGFPNPDTYTENTTENTTEREDAHTHASEATPFPESWEDAASLNKLESVKTEPVSITRTLVKKSQDSATEPESIPLDIVPVRENDNQHLNLSTAAQKAKNAYDQTGRVTITGEFIQWAKEELSEIVPMYRLNGSQPLGGGRNIIDPQVALYISKKNIKRNDGEPTITHGCNIITKWEREPNKWQSLITHVLEFAASSRTGRDVNIGKEYEKATKPKSKFEAIAQQRFAR